MRFFKVTLQNIRLGQETTLDVLEDHSILDAAKEIGLNFPLPCRTGTCNACIGKLLTGSLDQTEQSLLDDTQILEGYVLLCRAYALSDCKIATDWESGVLDSSYISMAIDR